MRALEALEWLDSRQAGDRATGRSYLMAVYYLRRLCREYHSSSETEGPWVGVDDHAPYSHTHLLETIRDLGRMAGLQLIIDAHRGIRLVGPPSSGAMTRLFNIVEDSSLSIRSQANYEPREATARRRPPPQKPAAVEKCTLWEHLDKDSV